MPRRLDAFTQGQGADTRTYTCSICGYEHHSNRNFRRSDDGEGHVCSTGHYEDKEGNLKRQANLYARKR